MSTDPAVQPISRRQLLASPLLLWLGKLFGGRTASAQPGSSSVAALAAGSIHQVDLATFDDSFLPPADLTFALVADTHTDKRRNLDPVSAETFSPELLGAKARNDLNDPRTAKVYAQLNALRPEFMIHLGDVVHGYPQERLWSIQVEKANRLLKLLEMPAHVVPGNHDIGNKPTVPMPAPTWPGAPEDARDAYYISDTNIEIFERDFGPSFFHFESGDNLFLVVNAYVFNTGLESEGKQWRWLEKTLARGHAFANVFVAMHPLPYWSRVDEPGKGNYEVVDEPARSRLLSMCEEQEVRAIFAGHIHHDHVRYHGSTLISGVPATSFSRDNWGLYYPLGAPTWDSARSAFCQIRVRGRQMVRQLIRTVDLLPEVSLCQQDNTHPPRRLIARQTGDGVAGPVAVTAPLMRDHAGLAAPENAISDRYRGARRADELRVAWITGKSGRGGHWLKIDLRRSQKISRVVLHPGLKSSFQYVLQLLSDDGTWANAADGTTDRPQGDRPPPAMEHRLEDPPASAVRLWVPDASRKISVRRLEVFNSEGVELTALPGFVKVKASRSERDVRIVNTAAFSQAFDLNPSYLRLAPRSTAWATVSPLGEGFHVDPFLIESARYAQREGARLWAVVSTERENTNGGAEPEAISAYCGALAQAFENAGVAPIWEIDGDRLQTTAAVATLSKSGGVRVASAAEGADFVVQRTGSKVVSPRRPTLLIHPPFPSRRGTGSAASLARWLAKSLASERTIPCVSLLPGEGLLDGWDNPMPAYYVVRTFNTVLAGAELSRPHCRDVAGLETVHFASSAGRFTVVSANKTLAPTTLRLRREAARAWWIDPVTSTSRRLEFSGRKLQGLLFPDYPVILRLV